MQPFFIYIHHPVYNTIPFIMFLRVQVIDSNNW